MIYLAGPLFTAAERAFNYNLADALERKFDESIFLPQDRCAACGSPGEIFSCCKDGIDRSRLVLAVLDGTDVDSGTAFEAGYAHAREIPVVGIRTDFRQRCDDGGLNLMLSRGCTHIIEVSSLAHEDCIAEIVAALAGMI